eukprot:scpid60759/ scgid0274/ 
MNRRAPPVLSFAVFFVLSLQCLYRGAEAYKVGMKYAQCDTLRVEHGTAASQPLQSSPYRITTDTTCGYQAGQLYNLTITGPALSGFVCRGQKTGTILLTDAVGSFPTKFSLPFTAGSPCFPSSSGLMNLYQTSQTHQYASPLRLIWQAPPQNEGDIEITCSLVTNFSVFYTTQRGDAIPFNPSANSRSCVTSAAPMAPNTMTSGSVSDPPSAPMASSGSVSDPSAPPIAMTTMKNGNASDPSTAVCVRAAYPHVAMPLLVTLLLAALGAW